MKKRMMALCLCAGLMAAAPMTVLAEEAATEAAAEAAETADAAAEEDDSVLKAPTDFTIDLETGDYSFNAVDERAGYYFVRFYALDEDGNESGEYITSSKRIKGGRTGEISGTLDLSGAAWGTYHINLTTFAPAGTGLENPAAETITAQFGVDETLERPELMVFTSGNQAEIILDWWTLCDYAFTQYMPDMKFTFYTDAECTQEAFTETVDLQPLMDTLRKNPPGMIYIWGWSTSEGPHFYTITSESDGGFGGGSSTFAFKNDIYTYTLDAGTYYVTAQALTKTSTRRIPRFRRRWRSPLRMRNRRMSMSMCSRSCGPIRS